jgi:hypothetical protein
MPKVNVNITEDNIAEWVHSVGYFLPRSNKELARFERLHHGLTHGLDINSVDPFAILNGQWQPKAFISFSSEGLDEEISELRMAARKHQDIPDEIFKQMKNNQEKDESSDNTEGQD